MKIAYITNVPVPEKSTTDAHFQELQLLKDTFGGDIISAFPFSKPNSLIPRSLYGMNNARELKRQAKSADLIHVFSPVYYPYRYLKHFRHNRLIYSTLTPVYNPTPYPSIDSFIVYDEKSKRLFEKKGVKNVHTSPPYVDFEKTLSDSPKKPFVLLMASAPWELPQFESKGIYLLLEALEQIPSLKIIFIWRNILADKMQEIIFESKFSDRIEFINENVNIVDYLHRCNAVILLAKYASLVKSYPHSLMEGLLAGKPVITTSAVPMSTYITKNNYGVVLNDFSTEVLVQEITSLIENYEEIRKNVQLLDPDSFSKQNFLSFYTTLYNITLK